MEDRLKGLRKSMQKTTFHQLTFTEQQSKNIREKIKKQEEREEDILFAVMQLLVSAKTGYELAKHLRSRGFQKFEDNEGALYIILHRLELIGMLQANWDAEEAKYYQITDKGSKILHKAEKKQAKKRVVFKELLEG